MAGDKEKDKESRWARVLAEAGLLDEVDDAWELPESAPIAGGATIKVRATAPSLSPEVVVDAGVGARNEDVTARIVSQVAKSNSAYPSLKEEETARVSYTASADDSRKSGGHSQMPFMPVTESDEPPRRVTRPPVKTDTDPAPLARHSQAGWGMPEASYEQPTRTVDISANKASVRSDEIQQVRPSVPGEQTLEDAVAKLQQDEDVKQQGRAVEVGGALISVPAYRETGGFKGRASIVDGPVSENPNPISVPPPAPTRMQMTQKYELGDFSGALDVAEQILAVEPQNMDALQFKKNCQEKLLQMYESRIGDMDHVPRLQVSNEDLMWRNLDASSGFILSRVDGLSSFDNILDISGMPRFETCRILVQLLQDGLIR